MAKVETKVTLQEAQDMAADLIGELAPHFTKALVAGSIRRGKEEIGDIDIVLIPKDTLFDHIDDIIEGTMAALKRPSTFELFNLGNSDPVELLDFIAAIEEGLGKNAKRNMMPIQPGDVPATAADIEKSKELLGFNPKTHIKEGIKNFLSWYRDYYSV